MWLIQSETVGSDGPVRYFWIPGFDDAYIIGDDGTLWSRYRHYGRKWVLSDDWTQRKTPPNGDGYLCFTLMLNGVRHERKIHQLVCEAVWGPCPVGLEVCHNDGVKLNCNWWNLRYDTCESNHVDRALHGVDNAGERSGKAKTTWVKVREIRAKFASGKYTQASLALEYGLNNGTISKIISNKIWIEDQVLVSS